MWFKMMFGDGNLNRMNPDGPYQVGLAQYTSEKHGNNCFIFYPIDKGTKGKASSIHTTDDIGLSLKIRCIITKFFNLPSTPAMFFKPIALLNINVEVEAPLAKDFASGDKKI